jgi:hypothetical protein
VRFLGGPGGTARWGRPRLLSYSCTRKAISDDGRGDRGKDRDRDDGDNVVLNDVNAALGVSGGWTRPAT